MQPPSPTGTESTNEDEGFNKNKPRRVLFGASGNLFRLLKETNNTLIKNLSTASNFDANN